MDDPAPPFSRRHGLHAQAGLFFILKVFFAPVEAVWVAGHTLLPSGWCWHCAVWRN